ncbi:MAG: ABC transporter permease subunit [Verrucomicrobia bacterium]|jgi:oligopeptide transport system permease protein|nr:ABC transporter permease subunit [Verrucomicrobiota bacterium]
MLKFLTRRLLTMIPVLWVTVTLTFFLVRLAPGGPFTEEKQYPQQAIDQLNQHYGLDAPIHLQYARYIGRLLRGDLGPSLKYQNRSVNEIISETFPVSLELGIWALLVALLLGLPAGIMASLRPNSVLDYAPMSLAMIGICIPSFVLGPLLVLALALGLGWFNASGWNMASDRILPAITLGSAYAAYIARLTRAGMLDVLPQDFIRTARAKGLRESRVIGRHALKPGIFPVISFLGPAVAGLITGSFVVETIFHIPGLGKMFVMGAFNRDYTLVLGLVVFYSALVILFNTVVDVVLAALNPRLRGAS